MPSIWRFRMFWPCPNPGLHSGNYADLHAAAVFRTPSNAPDRRSGPRHVASTDSLPHGPGDVVYPRSAVRSGNRRRAHPTAHPAGVGGIPPAGAAVRTSGTSTRSCAIIKRGRWWRIGQIGLLRALCEIYREASSKGATAFPPMDAISLDPVPSLPRVRL